MIYEPDVDKNRRLYKSLTKIFWVYLVSYTAILFSGLFPVLQIAIPIACLSGYSYIKNLSELLAAASRSNVGAIIRIPRSGLIALIPVWGPIYTYSRIKYIATLNIWDAEGRAS